MTYPIDEGCQALGAGAVIDVAALRALDDEAGQLQRLEVLGDGALGDTTSARQLGDRDLVGLGDPLEHGPSRRVGQCAQNGVNSSDLGHEEQLVISNS